MAASLPVNSTYDVFALAEAQQRQAIQSFTDVVITEDTVGNFSFDPISSFLSVKSTGGLSALVVGDGTTISLPAEFGFEISVLLPSGRIPADFSSLGTDRIFIGIENDQPSFDLVAGFLISEAGIALAASATSVLEVLPNTADLVAQFRRSDGEPLILRAAFKTGGPPASHILSIAVGLAGRGVFSYLETSLPFIYSGSDDRLNIEVIGPALDTRELLVGFMGLSTLITTYAVTVQPNPGPDQVAELGEVVRLDGRKSLPDESVIVTGTDLRTLQLEPSDDAFGTPISRLGNTVAGSGFTDTFTITAPATEVLALTNTLPGDFIEIDGKSYVIDTIVFPTITVADQTIPLGLTGVAWQTFSRTLVEATATDMTGVIVGDSLRVNNGDNSGIYLVESIESRAVPFRLRISPALKSAVSGMLFDIGPELRPPTTLTWRFLGGPEGTLLQDFTDIHRNGEILRFIPDVLGTYRFELELDSPSLDFVPSFIDVVVEVLDARISPGELPDAHFVWTFVTDFWSLVPDKARLEIVWSGLMQVFADELLRLYQYDYNKSLNDIQRALRRKWQKLETLQTLTEPFLSHTLPFAPNLKISGGGGRTLQDNIFEDTFATFINDEVEAGDILVLSIGQFAVAEVLSDTELRISGPGFQTGLTGLVWDIKFSLSVTTQELTDLVEIHPGDTVRFVITTTSGDVFRVEEEILLTVDRSVFINPDVPQISTALADRSLSFTSISVLEIEFLRRHNVFLLDTLVVKIPLLQEIIDTPAETYLHNLNYLVEPGRLRIIEDFNGNLPFAVQRASGITGTTATGNVFSDASATFVSDGVGKGDTLHIGVPTFKVVSVISETSIVVAGLVIAGQSGLSWRISHIAPDRLWAEFLDLDNSPSIQANFGHLVDLTKRSVDERLNFDYLSAVRGLFYSFFSGPKVDAIKVGLELLNALPVSEEDGEIIEITSPLEARIGRIRIRDTKNPAVVRVYFYPTSLGLATITDPITDLLRPLQVGDIVKKFQGLAQGVRVLDYINSPEWWKNAANQGLFSELEKFATFQVIISTEIFDQSNFDFISNFLNSIKPTYTKIAFIVQARTLFDEIEVLDSLSSDVSKTLIDGVFVPPASLDRRDGAGAPMYRLDFDTNFPVSLSPHVELAEVSKFYDLAAPPLVELARLSDIEDPSYVYMRGAASRFGVGSVQPDGMTFVSSTAGFLGSDVGKVIYINGIPRTIAAVPLATTVTLTVPISIFLNATWAITSSSGTLVTIVAALIDPNTGIPAPTGFSGTFSDTSAQFLNGAGIPLIDTGDFLEVVHPSINGGSPMLLHVNRVIDMTTLEVANSSTLFNISTFFPAGTHTGAAWRILRGLRYMPKPAIADVDLGDNIVLNESLVPVGRFITTRVTPTDTSPTTSFPNSSAPGLMDGDRDMSFHSVSALTSFVARFAETSLITNSAVLPLDGSVPTPLGLPVVKKLVVWDVLNVGSPAAKDGFLSTAQKVEVYITTTPSLNVWTLHETFNGAAGTPRAMRFDTKTELVFPTPPPGGVLGFKLHFPDGWRTAENNTITISELEMYLSEEFEHLKKNFHLDLSLDSRPEDVLSFRRVLAAGDALTGTGDVDGDSVTFTDDGTSFPEGFVFCFHDLGRQITIDGETRTIVEVIPETSALRKIKVNSALTGAPKVGVAWDITASGSNIEDGEVK